MELRGPTLTLRYPDARDADGLFAQARDPEVTRWFSWGPYRNVDEAAAWIAGQSDRRELGVQLDFVVHLRDHGPIGVTGLSELSIRDRRAVVGTWLGRAYWGTGANMESKALMAHLAFAVCGLHRVGAYSNPHNMRSTRALERIGFQREGTLRQWHRHGDEPLDVHVYGLLRDEWKATPLYDTDVTVTGPAPPAWMISPPGVNPS